MRPKHVRLRLVAATAVVSLFAALGLATPASASSKPVAPAADTNLAAGKPITASSHVYDFVETNANDNNVGTYWESAGGAYPATLSVDLGAKANISSVVVKLNPDPIWGTRTQTIEVLGRPAHTGNFTSLVGATSYTFNPNSGANTVTIPVSATVADVQLKFTSNSGAPGGQVGELQVMGSAAPAPDLTISDMSWTPSSPVETDSVSLKATVKNTGTAASDATNVNFYLSGQKVGTASVGALAAGASSAVTVSAGTRTAGTYQLVGKVDEADTVLELNETNNSYTNPTSLVVAPVSSSDLVASVSWSPSNPSSGNNVSFNVAVKNQGTIASGSGSHGITLTLLDANNAVVKTLTGSVSGTIAAGATAPAVNLGSWTAANGKYTVKVVLANDPNELPVKQANNTSTTPFFVGRGANMPYDSYEAEDGVLAGGATVVGPNRTIGDLGGEASGRRAVKLASTGSSVEFTTKASTNTLVTRFAIPDASGGGGINSTLGIYVDGTFLKTIDLTSHYAWLYGNETGPGNSPDSTPRHIYDEAHVLLGTTVAAGHKIRLQKDAANSAAYYSIDFINTEQVSPIANPDPSKYTVPAGFAQQDVQNALDKARQDPTLTGVYLPAGTYQTSGKLQVYGKAIKMVGAGPWYTQFQAPTGQENTDIGIRADSTANGSTFSGFAYFGNYTSRIDGPGKVFDLQNVANDTIDNIWVEHMVCMYWGNNTDHMTITNSRIRDTFADGINMTNGSSDNLVSNDEARSTGDDSFALFAATDSGSSGEKNNVLQNLTAILPWRAAGLAVYGGQDNTVKNIYIADTLTYSGITISSLDFGYPMEDFGPDQTTFSNISIVRAGGHFWGAQTFPAIWMFSASKQFRAIRVTDVDIVDPTYSGIMFQTNYVGGQPQNPVTDTVLTNVTISGAHKSGDAYDAKSGFGIWANELPEPGQGPAVGSATFNNLKLSDNAVDIRNTTTTFTINRP
ncbi:CARDB domain-containing protein [Actinomadura sp. DC4]|uniref:CARDB domain-containing protein n=1 Tax=Actinomadura sp. DC4 TaxID=3055069 RepID=UPI0025AEE47A|nr:CARDB domain-containing protein [Actinomadura sp. DC4]MDN3351463.1 CARDB domain-containing protein [Actinomadura sp. DC4]